MGDVILALDPDQVEALHTHLLDRLSGIGGGVAGKVDAPEVADGLRQLLDDLDDSSDGAVRLSGNPARIDALVTAIKWEAYEQADGHVHARRANRVREACSSILTALEGR
jgi:hypothetical protein